MSNPLINRVGFPVKFTMTNYEKQMGRMEESIKNLDESTKTQFKKIDEINKTLNKHCVEIKLLKNEVKSMPTKVASEVEKFLDNELKDRDNRMTDIEKEVSGIRGRVYMIAAMLAAIVGAISSKAREVLF